MKSIRRALHANDPRRKERSGKGEWTGKVESWASTKVRLGTFLNLSLVTHMQATCLTLSLCTRLSKQCITIPSTQTLCFGERISSLLPDSTPAESHWEQETVIKREGRERVDSGSDCPFQWQVKALIKNFSSTS